MSKPGIFVRMMIVFGFLGSLYCFGGAVRTWAKHTIAEPPCVDIIGACTMNRSEEVACKRPDQTLTWVPATPTGFVYRCTCYREPKK